MEGDKTECDLVDQTREVQDRAPNESLWTELRGIHILRKLSTQGESL